MKTVEKKKSNICKKTSGRQNEEQMDVEETYNTVITVIMEGKN